MKSVKIVGGELVLHGIHGCHEHQLCVGGNTMLVFELDEEDLADVNKSHRIGVLLLDHELRTPVILECQKTMKKVEQLKHRPVNKRVARKRKAKK